MTVKELKELLKNYKDTDEVWVSGDLISDCYGEEVSASLYIEGNEILKENS